jgi:hypothetical protein
MQLPKRLILGWFFRNFVNIEEEPTGDAAKT